MATITTPSAKMTKAQKFALIAAIPEVANDPMLSEFIAHEQELLAKKNSSDKKPTAQQVANDGVKTAVLAVMEADPNRMWTVTELMKQVPGLPEDMTNQRLSAIMRQLKDAGTVKRDEIKRKAFFSLA